jgi:hypothetical protein
VATDGRNLRRGRPVWQGRRAPDVAHARLSRGVTRDVFIIGAGITGALVADALAAAEVAIDGAKYEKAVACLTKYREASAHLLRLPGRTCDHLHFKPDRERVRYGPSSDSADEGIPVGDRQVDGVQARHRGRKDLAEIEGRNQLPKVVMGPRAELAGLRLLHGRRPNRDRGPAFWR